MHEHTWEGVWWCPHQRSTPAGQLGAETSPLWTLAPTTEWWDRLIELSGAWMTHSCTLYIARADQKKRVIREYCSVLGKRPLWGNHKYPSTKFKVLVRGWQAGKATQAYVHVPIFWGYSPFEECVLLISTNQLIVYVHISSFYQSLLSIIILKFNINNYYQYR